MKLKQTSKKVAEFLNSLTCFFLFRLICSLDTITKMWMKLKESVKAIKK